MPKKLTSIPGLELTENDETVITRIVATDIDPSVVGLDQPVGTLAISTNGTSYLKFDSANTDWKFHVDSNNFVPFFKVNTDQLKIVLNNIENGVHFRLTNQGKIVNNGRILVRC